MTHKVIVNGANGKMGKVTCQTILDNPEFDLIGRTDREDDLDAAIASLKPDIVIDFTTPDSAYNNANIIINHKVHPVIGTTGFTPEQIDDISNLCSKKKLGAIIAPNFSLGAILMMKYAADAAKYFSQVEIIEMHHQQKLDAPSGTARKTQQMIQKENPDSTAPIHSVRLPGLFAHQAVIFGSPGETLTIRHDCIDRQAMMPGVLLACHKVLQLNHLVYGLEHCLDN